MSKKFKLKENLNIILLFLFIVSIIYCIVTLTINLFSTEDINTNITSQNVDIYLTGKNEIKEYNAFFNTEIIIQNIITDFNEGKYKEIYSIFTSDFKKKISENDFIAKAEEYVSKNFKYYLSDYADVVGYDNTKNLKHLYLVESGNCVAIVKSNNENKETRIGLVMIDNEKYKISYLDL